MTIVIDTQRIYNLLSMILEDEEIDTKVINRVERELQDWLESGYQRT